MACGYSILTKVIGLRFENAVALQYLLGEFFYSSGHTRLEYEFVGIQCSLRIPDNLIHRKLRNQINNEYYQQATPFFEKSPPARFHQHHRPILDWLIKPFSIFNQAHRSKQDPHKLRNQVFCTIISKLVVVRLKNMIICYIYIYIYIYITWIQIYYNTTQNFYSTNTCGNICTLLVFVIEASMCRNSPLPQLLLRESVTT